jgi:hypothetical protein
MLVKDCGFDKIAESQKIPLENLAEFQELAALLPIVVWIAGRNGLCKWCNELWQQLTNRSLEEEIGQKWIEAIHPEDRSRCSQSYYYAFISEREFQIEHRVINFNGDSKRVLSTGKPYYTATGFFNGYIIYSIEIAEQKSKLPEAERISDEQLTELLNSIALHLHKPLTRIKTATKLISLALSDSNSLLSAQQDQQKILAWLQILQEDCEREISLIDSFTSSPILKSLLRDLAESSQIFL